MVFEAQVGLTTDNAGTLLSSYKYDPYGRSIGAPHDTLGYAGGQRAPGGLTHYGARYYDPQNGRWTQQDPLNQVSDLRQANRYAYVGGDPVNQVDPTGLGLRDIVGGVIEVATGVGVAGAATFAFAACARVTLGEGTAHCAATLYPYGALGAGVAVDGARRIYRGAS